MRPDEVYRLARDAGLDDPAAIIATAIAWSESQLRPDAVGDENLEDEKWGPSVGLWQVRSLRAHTGTGLDRDRHRLTDPAFNARSMGAISARGSDWSPWTDYRNGKYRAYLDDVVEAADGAGPMSPTGIVLAVAAELEELGVPVQFVPGWQGRGRPYSFNPRGVVCHHTATKGYSYDYPSLGIVRDGRSDLPGPLSQFGIGRHTGTVYVIAAGYANHAGGGGWGGLTGNGSTWGIEAENDGIGEEWGPEMLGAYLALVTALCRHTGIDADMVCRHAEWSDGGKIDTATAPMNDGDWIRAQVAARLAAPEPDEEEDMALPIFGDSPEGRPYAFWMIDGAFKKKLHTSAVWEEAQAMAQEAGLPAPKHVGKIPLALFDALIDMDELPLVTKAKAEG
jgi:hypothetical protein